MGQFVTKKLKIWYLFNDRPQLTPLLGDSINECRVIKILSKFAEVYYNGILVKDGDEKFGCETGINFPTEKFDLYIVRGSSDIFAELPSPKICAAYPYNEATFRQADGLFVTTSIWKKIITGEVTGEKHKAILEKWYPENAYFPSRIIQLRQACDPNVSLKSSVSSDQNEWKYKLTNHLTFGFYGRLADDALPHSFIAYHNKLSKKYGASAPALIFAGRLRGESRSFGWLPENSVYLETVDYLEMSNLLSVTDYTLAGEGLDDAFLGSNKILDSINCETPVVCLRNDVREEYLGQDYLGLYNDEKSLDHIVTSIIHDEAFRNELRKQTAELAISNHPQNAADFNEKEIWKLIDSL